MPCADIRGTRFPVHPESGDTATTLGVSGILSGRDGPDASRTVLSGEDSRTTLVDAEN